MLPQAQRLRRRSDFRRVYERSRALSTPSLIFRYQWAAQGRRARVGIVVGSKVSKRATVRNRIKRQLREAIRPMIGSEAGYDLVIIARPKALSGTFAEFSKDCAGAMRTIQKRANTTIRP